MLKSGFNLPKYGGSQVAPIQCKLSHPEPGVELLEPITTKALVVPRRGPFKKGETLTFTDNDGLRHSVEFRHYDYQGGGRSFVSRDGVVQNVFTYRLNR